MSLQPKDLLGCPFCGGLPTEGEIDPGAPYPGALYYIACENEGCFMEDVWVVEKGLLIDKEKIDQRLRKKWNTRRKKLA